VKLRRLESAAQFGHYIAAFNINTNGWVASYVYKVPLPPSSETTFLSCAELSWR
jgi:hypothetical protein